MRRKVVFEPSAFEDFNQWATLDKKVHKKVVGLLKDIDRAPFTGLGKPEALKHDLKGYWSRRITHEHRLVYSVSDTAITVIACKYHYG